MSPHHPSSQAERIIVNKPPRYLAGLGATALAVALIAGCGKQSGQAPAGQPQAAASVAVPVAPEKKAGYTIAAEGLGQPDGTPVQLSSYTLGADGKWSYGKVGDTEVKGGKFTLSGPAVQVPVPGLLQVGEMGGVGYADIRLIVENTNYRVSSLDSVLVAKGGHYNDLVFGYTWSPEYVAAVKAKDAAESKVYAGIDPSDQKAMLKAKMDSIAVIQPYYMAAGKIAGDYLTKITNGQNDDLARFYALINNPDPQSFPPEKREALMAEFGKTLADNPEYQNMTAGEAMEAKAAAVRDALVKGAPYNDITVADKDGHEVKLSDVLKKNKFVLLDFWASWCAPCREEFPHLAKVYRDYHDAGFEIYGVSLDEGRNDWLKAMKQESDNGHLPWINLRAQGFFSKAAEAYGVRGLPNNFLISSDGTIVGKDMRGDDVEKVVASELRKLGKSKG